MWRNKNGSKIGRWKNLNRQIKNIERRVYVFVDVMQ